MKLKTISNDAEYVKVKQIAFIQRRFGLIQHAKRYEKMLLDYRRANSFYEVGDIVKLISDGMLYRVISTYLDYIEVGYGPMDMRNFIHANDDEIEEF